MPPQTPRYKEKAPSRETFRPDDRIRRRSEYLRVQQQGRRVQSAHFVMAVLPGREGPRLGVTVSKKVGSAVQRNRIRRVAREVFRRNRDLFPDGGDVVMIARSGAEKLDYHDLRDEVERAAASLRRAARPRPDQAGGPAPPDPVSVR